jgi:hypothetical protein
VHGPGLAEAFARCAEVGWAWCPAAVARDQADALAGEVADVALIPLEHAVGQVRQRGATGVAAIHGRPRLTAFAAELAQASGGWSPDEVAIGRYGPGGGISAHRDNTFYTDFVVVLTVSGRARFRVLGDRAATVVHLDVVAGPGDVALLRGPRSDVDDARPFHDVGPPEGDEERTVLVLRRNARGAGRGWS